jgi:hypothetical protein
MDGSIDGELDRGGLACGPSAAVVAVKIQNRARDAARDLARSLLTRAEAVLPVAKRWTERNG